jgi:branched-chain amino acid transport system substrate-binding protein
MATSARIATLLAAVAVGLACRATVTTREPAPIVLGAVYNLTGRQAQLDVPSAQGARLAVEEVNRAGGLLGRPVQLVLEDGRSETAIVAERTADLLDRFPAVPALIGLSDADMVLAAATVASQRQRLFLTSGATSPHLPAQVPGPLYLACFGDNVQAAAAAEWAVQDLSARTAAVVFDASSSTARLLHGYFQTRFSELGGRVRWVRSFTRDDLSALGRPPLPKADFVFLAAADPEQALAAVLRLREAGVTAPILGGDAFDALDPWSEHPELTGIYFTAHAYLGADSAAPKLIAFRESYGRAFPESAPDAFAALGYDAARLAMAAIARAGNADPREVLRALGEIQGFEGVTGTIGYPAGSRIPLKTVTVLAIEAGKRRLVRQLLPSHVPPP